MSEKRDEGGPAFPASMLVEGMVAYQPGMSLRDWFAGQALSVSREGSPISVQREAEWAYRLADAMMKARQS